MATGVGVALTWTLLGALPACAQAAAQPDAKTAAPAPAHVRTGRSLRVAAASDLAFVMPAMIWAYEHEKGVKLNVTLGSSGALATQIGNGAPFDVFLGADFSFPEHVIASGKAIETTPVPYATGALVLWARKDSPIKPLSVEKLSSDDVKRVAVADQFHAPYGRAAYAALRAMKIEDKVKGKLVVGENVAQTAQFAETGNAQMALIPLTLALSDKLKGEGEFVRMPMVYPDIEQCAVVMKGAQAEEGKAFLDWLRSPVVQGNLKQFGLEPAK